MKKILLVLLTGLFLFLSTPVAFAQEENGEVEIIEDEETPEAAPNKGGFDFVLLSVATGCILVLAYAWKKNSFRLYVSSVRGNNDGSYTVGWGYKNLHLNDVKFDENETGFKVKKGVAIYLKNDEDKTFYHGKHNDHFVTVVNEDTEIEWFAGDQLIQLDREVLNKYKKEEKR